MGAQIIELVLKTSKLVFDTAAELGEFLVHFLGSVSGVEGWLAYSESAIRFGEHVHDSVEGDGAQEQGFVKLGSTNAQGFCGGCRTGGP